MIAAFDVDYGRDGHASAAAVLFSDYGDGEPSAVFTLLLPRVEAYIPGDLDKVVKSPQSSLRGAERRGNPTCKSSRPEAALGGSKELPESRGDPSLLSGQCFALDCRAEFILSVSKGSQ